MSPQPALFKAPDGATQASQIPDLAVSTCAAASLPALEFLSLVPLSSLISEVLGGNALTVCGHLGALQCRLRGQETSVLSPSH